MVFIVYENYKNIVYRFVVQSWPEIEDKRLCKTLSLIWVMVSLRGNELRGKTNGEQISWLLVITGRVMKVERALLA